MKAKTYLIIDAVLVLGLIAFQVAPGVADMLALFSIRQIRSHRIFCFLIFAFLTLINFICTMEMVLAGMCEVFNLS